MALPNVAPTYQYIGGESADGVIMGTTTSGLLGFFGTTTPISQPTNANEAAVATTVPSSTQVAYTLTSAQQNGIIVLLNQIRADLVALNLIKGS